MLQKSRKFPQGQNKPNENLVACKRKQQQYRETAVPTGAANQDEACHRSWPVYVYANREDFLFIPFSTIQ